MRAKQPLRPQHINLQYNQLISNQAYVLPKTKQTTHRKNYVKCHYERGRS